MTKNDSQPFDFFQTEKKLKGGLLRSIAMSLIIMSVGFTLFTGFAFREFFFRFAIIGVVISTSCLIVLWMIQREKISIAGIILVTTIWFIVNLMTYTAGGIHAPVFVSNMIFILLTSMLLGNTAGLWAIVLSVLFGISLVVADANQMLPPDIEYPPFARLAIYTFLFVL